MEDPKRLTVALVHQPVLNRNGNEIVATVDHYDVLDASRLSFSYPMWRMYIVNRLSAQRALIEKALKDGSTHRKPTDGSAFEKAEEGAFSRTKWAPDVDAVIEEIRNELNVTPTVVCTSARACDKDKLVSFEDVRRRLSNSSEEHILLLVGKGWGFTEEFLDKCDLRLVPIDGGTGYNHLSVRSALSILIDRLCRTSK